jgi:hypothetical protein
VASTKVTVDGQLSYLTLFSAQTEPLAGIPFNCIGVKAVDQVVPSNIMGLQNMRRAPFHGVRHAFRMDLGCTTVGKPDKERGLSCPRDSVT